MHYTTVKVKLVGGGEAQSIDDAIAKGLKALSEETGGPVELVNFVPMVFDDRLCVTVMAKPYEPPVPVVAAQALVNDILLRERFRKQ